MKAGFRQIFCRKYLGVRYEKKGNNDNTIFLLGIRDKKKKKWTQQKSIS
jgi:hypothetical protein